MELCLNEKKKKKKKRKNALKTGSDLQSKNQ